MDIVVIKNVKYNLHPIYDLFGANENGEIINIVNRQPPEVNNSGKIRVKSHENKTKLYKILVFIWETHNGFIPHNLHVERKDNDEMNNSVNNLVIVKRTLRKRLSPEERLRRNNEKKERWRNTEWTCSDCGFKTNNNASRHHKRVCKYSTNKYTQEELDRRAETNENWRIRRFICEFCGEQYSNNYKTVHKRICENRMNALIE